MVSVNWTKAREAIITLKKFKEFILYTYLFNRIIPLFIFNFFNKKYISLEWYQYKYLCFHKVFFRLHFLILMDFRIQSLVRTYTILHITSPQEVQLIISFLKSMEIAQSLLV